MTGNGRIIEIPELVIDNVSYSYSIFGYSLNGLYSGNANGVIVNGSVSEIADISLYYLAGFIVYYDGTMNEWLSLDRTCIVPSFYCYDDCVHRDGIWSYDEQGNVTVTIVEKEFVVITLPTCKSEGLGKYVCPVCHKEEPTQSIPVSNDHNLVNGECVDCGLIAVTADNFGTLEYITTNGFAIDSYGVITSQNRDANSSSTLTITATETMTVNFSYKVSSEENYDYLTVYVNGVQAFRVSGTNKLGYTQYSVTLNAGDRLAFQYSKDSGVDSGDDRAYVKNLTIKLEDRA